MDLPSNSHKMKSAEENLIDKPKNIESVVTGEVRRRKTPLGRRFAETFVGGDAQSVMSYVVFEVLVPAAKDMVSDAFSQGIDRMLFGDSRSTTRRRSSGTGTNGYVSYNRMSGGISKPRSGFDEFTRKEPSRRARSNHDFDEIILATRHEAEEVIKRLYDIVDQYETATVADLYELVGMTPSFTDAKWGWGPGGLQGAQPVRTRGGGYLLDLPKPEAVE
jgi:hypothetical protein